MCIAWAARSPASMAWDWKSGSTSAKCMGRAIRNSCTGSAAPSTRDSWPTAAKCSPSRRRPALLATACIRWKNRESSFASKRLNHVRADHHRGCLRTVRGLPHVRVRRRRHQIRRSRPRPMSRSPGSAESWSISRMNSRLPRLAGTPVAAVRDAVGPRQTSIPAVRSAVGRGSATLGGKVASGLSGSGRFRYGGVRDFLLGVSS